MVIEVDTREKPRAIKSILETFDTAGVKHISTKLYVGDYRTLENPRLIIDRKQNIGELAQNATSGHDRFKRELMRLDDISGEMVVLVEQNRYKDVSGRIITVREIADLMGWKNPHGTVDGVTVFRVLSAWEYKHNVRFDFCGKSETGRRVLEILGNGEQWLDKT